jgi:tRNA modification GTPase
VKELRISLLDVCALLELTLDFAEEGLDVVEPKAVIEKLDSLTREIRRLANSFERGRVAREGIAVVFAGLPNAGKSSLFNALLKESRAIVTELPGTTRDTIEESIVLSGVEVRLIDTAGMREAKDVAEWAGIERTLAAVRSAEVVLYVFDPMNPSFDEVESFCRGIRVDQKVLIVMNKVDLLLEAECRVPRSIEERWKVVRTSAKSGDGIQRLSEEIEGFLGVAEETEPTMVISQRHYDKLSASATCLEAGIASLLRQQSNEFAAVDVREAIRHLAEITGEVTSEEILNSIFSRFCIGK